MTAAPLHPDALPWLQRVSDVWYGRERNRQACHEMAVQVRVWVTMQLGYAGQELLDAANVLDAYALWREGHFLEALGALEVVLQRPARNEWFLRALNVQAGLEFELGDVGRSLTTVQEQLELARELGDTVQEGSALHDLGVVYTEQGNDSHQDALRYLLLAEEKFRQADHLDGLAFTQMSLAQRHLLRGEEALARQRLLQAQALADQVGLPYVQTMLLAFQAQLEEAQHPEQAEYLLRQALKRQQQHGDRPMWEAMEPLTRLLQRQGRYQEAADLITPFLAQAQQENMRPVMMQFHGVLAELYEQLGQPALALQHLKQHVQELKLLREREHQQRLNALEVMHRTQMLRSLAAAEEQRAETLARLHLTDDLTQVPNRRHLMQRAPELLRASGTLALLDIDHFKRVNDDLGHSTGDQVLLEFAQRLRAHLPEAAFLARYGGEEFVVIFPELSAPQAFQVLNRFRLELLAQPITVSNLRRLTFTAGLTECRDSDLAAALRRADGLLLQGKRDGRNRVLVYEVYAANRVIDDGDGKR